MYKQSVTAREAIEFFDKKFIDIYLKTYSKMIGKNDLKNIVSMSNEVVSNSIKNPGKNSLIVGSVQSGKTAFYLSLIANLFDNESNIGVLFPATDHILFNQTMKRVKETFNIKVRVITVNDIKKSDIDAKVFEIKEAIKENKVILMGLKNSTRIKIIKDILTKLTNVKRPFIIDDEGDQASFDNINIEDPTDTYNALTILKNSINKFSYFSITATPYAHIFVDKKSEMKPDFAYPLSTSEMYTGINWYHNQDTSHYTKIIKQIPENDLQKLSQQKIAPNSLKMAITEYFVMTAIKHLIDGEPSETSFLMHSHRKNIDHNAMFQWVSGITRNIKKKIRDRDPKVISQIMDFLNDSTLEFDIKQFDALCELIVKHIDNSRVVIGNQKNVEFSEILREGSNELNNLYIGSQMLQRGVTLPNLLITYFANRTSQTGNADTIMQRARWFGYRENYKFLTRIYMDQKSKFDFEGLLLANDDMFERLRDLKDVGYKFDSDSFEERLLVGSADLKATRNSVVLNGKVTSSRVIRNETVNNIHIAEELWNLVSKSKHSSKKNELKFNEIAYDDYKSFEENIDTNELLNVFDKLDSQAKRAFVQNIIKNDYRIKIVNMGVPFEGSAERIRSIDKKKLSNLMQGRSQEDKKTNYYFGDSSLYEHEGFANTVTIQIHKVRIRNTENVIYKVVIVSPTESVTDNIFRRG